MLLALLAASFVVAQTCQQSQVRVSQDQAIASAREQIDFRPERTQIRLVRQGLRSRPFWAVSFSIPLETGQGYSRLTTVRIDANNGEVAAVTREQAAPPE